MGLPSEIENANPFAAPGVWYGSCPTIQTFTSSGCVRLSALKILSYSGNKIFPLERSSKAWFSSWTLKSSASWGRISDHFTLETLLLLSL